MHRIILILVSVIVVSCSDWEKHGEEGEVAAVPEYDTDSAYYAEAVEDSAYAAEEASEEESEVERIYVTADITRPGVQVTINGCNFRLVEEKGDTIYLYTNDNNFITPEGYHVGTL